MTVCSNIHLNGDAVRGHEGAHGQIDTEIEFRWIFPWGSLRSDDIRLNEAGAGPERSLDVFKGDGAAFAVLNVNGERVPEVVTFHRRHLHGDLRTNAPAAILEALVRQPERATGECGVD